MLNQFQFFLGRATRKELRAKGFMVLNTITGMPLTTEVKDTHSIRNPLPYLIMDMRDLPTYLSITSYKQTKSVSKK